MACYCASSPFSPFPHRDLPLNNPKFTFLNRSKPLLLTSVSTNTPSYNSLVYEAVRLLGPPARFEASKLKVIFVGEELNNFNGIIPRTYTLSHCDFTANLTLTISSVINLEQLEGWFSKDDVVAEWKKVNGDLCLHVHCYVGGPNLFIDLAEFRYHIFSKELPLVLKAVLHGESLLFRKHPELLNALVRVYFHSSTPKYNCMEYWGPLKVAAEGMQIDESLGTERKDHLLPAENSGSWKSIFQVLFAFLL